MTEAHWIQCGDSEAYAADWVALGALGDRVSARKLRLFVCACVRLVPVIAHEAHRRALEIGELFADGEVSEAEREAADKRAGLMIGMGALPCRYCAQKAITVSDARYASHAAAGGQLKVGTVAEQQAHKRRDLLHHAKLLRDVFGDTFRPVTFSPTWRTDTAIALARQMYESREFSAMPILADALQDAGCDNTDVLDHCRDANQPHARGCWVVDLVLGKE